MVYRINTYKNWLKDGFLNYYHLPIFHNIEVFINDLKIYFSRKFYGENDYSKVTPDMICLRFISTTCATYEELCSIEDKNLNYYNKLYNNEIIWVNGLILQNAKLDEDYCQYLIPNLNNEKTKIKMNIIGITYTIYKYIEDEKDNNNEEKENNGTENEVTIGEESGSESYMTESKNNTETNGNNDNGDKKDETHENKNNKDSKDNHNNNKGDLEEYKKVKVYIYEKRSRSKYHKYYKENSIGFMEFLISSNKIDQNFIYEHDIKIFVDEFGEYDEPKKKE
jgi:hypothetical protein